MYVAGASDSKVYPYDTPDPIDTRLTSLTLSDPDCGECSPSQREYEGIASDGVTETTVAAPTEQRRATVVIEPADSGEVADSHQATVADGTEITVTVTSPDASRTRAHLVRLGEGGGGGDRGAVGSNSNHDTPKRRPRTL